MDESNWHIVISEGFEHDAIARAQAVARVTVLTTGDEHALKEAVRDCDALLVRTSAAVTRDVIERAGRLRVIGRAGSGLDNIDVEAARERGILVIHTPDAASNAVADLTIGLMIALVRGITNCDAAVRTGRFASERSHYVTQELSELTLGIVGLGRIGKAVAQRCFHGFAMHILYNDILNAEPLGFEATPTDKAQLFRQADVVSLHVPLTERTRRLIEGEAMTRFKRGSFLINTARGAVVDSVALAHALESGHLAGAALDVFDPEPLPKGHPLLTAPNTLFTPHVGARSRTGLTRMNAVVDEVIRVLEESRKVS